MKNLFKVLLAVVALVVVGCTTDVTEDLAVNIDKGNGRTSIAVSLEESRTQLGEKANGIYPLYWSKGDKIAINGVASAALGEEFDGQSAAIFAFEGELTTPYNIVYPAPAEGVVALSEGQYPVVFPAVQFYTEGGFANGVAPMYGNTTSADGDDNAAVQMQHLTGVLRLAVKGEGVVLRNLAITTEVGNIAGTYDVDCATGTLTPHDDVTNTVIVSFGEGLKLGAEATPIYVAIPAGDYGKFSLLLTSTSGQMALAFNSSVKPISAGKVREFAEFTYTTNKSESEIYLIDSKDALIEFAKIADNFAPYKEAKVVSDIDMTGVEWTPIDGFGFTFNGNNKAIKGLSAPLFGTTIASIKDLKLADVNITSNGLLRVGAVACTLINDGFGGASVSNCSVSGKITISNPNYTPAAVAEGDTLCDIVNCGGLVGLSQGGVVSNCVNEATIQVNQVAKSGHTVALHPSFGGIVGAVAMNAISGVNVSAAILDCENKGAINYHDNEETQILFPHIGGIVGLSWEEAYEGTLANCVNRGAIDVNANTNGHTTVHWDAGLTVGGIAGSMLGYVDKCDNYGKITLSGGKIKAFYIGGVAGTSRPRMFTNCHNHTSGTIEVAESVRAWSVNVAGLLAGYTRSSLYTGEEVADCSNDGAITVKCSTDTAIALGTYYYRVAGIFCYANQTSRNCENKANGDITVSGDIIVARNNDQSCFGVCGTVAYHTTEGNTYQSVNRGDLNIYVNVSKHSGITDATHCKLNISGLGGYHTRAIGEKAENYGHITIGKAGVAQTIAGNGIYIAGIMAHGTSISCKPVNEGNITIHDKVTFESGAEIFIGGIGGYYTGNVQNATNKGNITVGGTSTSTYQYVGGITGYSYKKGETITTANCTNSGNIAINSAVGSGSANGGIIGRSGGAAKVTNCSNTGDVTLNGTTTNHAFTAGIIGMASTTTFTNCHNNGVMTVTKIATAPKELYMGGIVGYSSAITLDNCSNSTKEGVKYGIIMSKEASGTGGGNGMRLGGIFGRANGAVTTKNGVTNSAGILMDGNQLGTAGLSIGGIGGILGDGHAFGGLVHNSGEIYYKGRCARCNFGLGGCFASPGGKAMTFDNIINTGDIIVEKLYDDSFPNASGKSFQVGGVVGNGAGPLSNAQVFCKMSLINFKSNATNSFGMLKGSPSTGTTITNSKIGGSIALEEGKIDEDADGSDILGPMYEPLTTENYLKYIYNNEITEEKAKTDKITLIESASEIDYTVATE